MPAKIEQIESVISKFVSIDPKPTEVWLIGSRANDRAREESDWDFLVFGSTEYLKELKNRTDLNDSRIDLLVVYDGNQFVSPFNDKAGDLISWHWNLSSATEATYKGTKTVPNPEESKRFECEMFTPIISKLKAIRIWPKI